MSSSTRSSCWRCTGVAWQADALAACRQLRDTLGQELGIGPSRMVSDLQTAILRQDPELDLATPAVALPGLHPSSARRLSASRALLRAVPQPLPGTRRPVQRGRHARSHRRRSPRPGGPGRGPPGLAAGRAHLRRPGPPRQRAGPRRAPRPELARPGSASPRTVAARPRSGRPGERAPKCRAKLAYPAQRRAGHTRSRPTPAARPPSRSGLPCRLRSPSFVRSPEWHLTTCQRTGTTSISSVDRPICLYPTIPEGVRS